MPGPGAPEGTGKGGRRVDQRDPGRAGTLRVPDAVHKRHELGTDRGEDRVWRKSGLCEVTYPGQISSKMQNSVKKVVLVGKVVL